MKGILEFNLPEEESEHLIAVKASSLHSAIDDLRQEIRRIRKYGDKREVSIELIEKKFYEVLRDNGVDELLG